MEDDDFKYYPQYSEKVCMEKMAMYAENMIRFDLAFSMFGVQKFHGNHDGSLAKMAADALVEIRKYLGTDRLVISDTMAIVPNYYARLENKNIDDLLTEDDPTDLLSDSHPLYLNPSGDVHLVYTVGFELVIRDIRNYLALASTIRGRHVRMYISHSALRVSPTISPNANVATLDIPVGMIMESDFDPVARRLAIKVKGLNGETDKYTFGTTVSMESIGAVIDQMILNEESLEDPTDMDQALAGVLKLVQDK